MGRGLGSVGCCGWGLGWGLKWGSWSGGDGIDAIRLTSLHFTSLPASNYPARPPPQFTSKITSQITSSLFSITSPIHPSPISSLTKTPIPKEQKLTTPNSRRNPPLLRRLFLPPPLENGTGSGSVRAVMEGICAFGFEIFDFGSVCAVYGDCDCCECFSFFWFSR